MSAQGTTRYQVTFLAIYTIQVDSAALSVRVPSSNPRDRLISAQRPSCPTAAALRGERHRRPAERHTVASLGLVCIIFPCVHVQVAGKVASCTAPRLYRAQKKLFCQNCPRGSTN